MNKLEQAARALLAKWDAHPYTPWREVGFISGDVANLREALAEPKKPEECANGCPPLQVCDYCQTAEQAEQEPVAFQMICPQCKVDRVTTPCPRGGVSDCPMTATAQNAAPVKTICYQEVCDALEAQLIKEPTGNGLDQLAQNNGLVMAMNTIQKMNLTEQSDSERMEPVALIEECREALAQELMAYDIDPPIHHVKQAHDKCVAWLFNRTAPVRTKDLTDEEAAAAAYKGFDDYWTEDCKGLAAEAWLASARAVIAADREKNK